MERFKSLVREMKQAGTQNLLIDFRENPGGDSKMADILIYCLFGKETMVAKPLLGSKVVKLLEKKGNDVVSPQGMRYNFREDFSHFGYPPAQMLLAAIKQQVSRSPVLKEEFETGEYSGYYRPENILVLVSR